MSKKMSRGRKHIFLLRLHFSSSFETRNLKLKIKLLRCANTPSDLLEKKRERSEGEGRKEEAINLLRICANFLQLLLLWVSRQT